MLAETGDPDPDVAGAEAGFPVIATWTPELGVARVSVGHGFFALALRRVREAAEALRAGVLLA